MRGKVVLPCRTFFSYVSVHPRKNELIGTKADKMAKLSRMFSNSASSVGVSSHENWNWLLSLITSHTVGARSLSTLEFEQTKLHPGTILNLTWAPTQILPCSNPLWVSAVFSVLYELCAEGNCFHLTYNLLLLGRLNWQRSWTKRSVGKAMLRIDYKTSQKICCFINMNMICHLVDIHRTQPKASMFHD